MKVVVDTLGGDNAPYEIVKGAIDAQKKYKDLGIIFCGKEDEINRVLSGLSFNSEKVEVVSAPEEITNDDVPTVAIKTKKDSSLAVAFEILRSQNDVVGLVSAGNTGAILAGGFLRIGRIKGVSRPMLCPFLPTKTGGYALIADCGANMDSKPINLVHYALMANEYYKERFGNPNPRIALLSVGTEDHKGNELVHEVFPLLQKLDINFVGNMEARDIMSGKYDVVVCDGFAGNVLLKSTEGALKLMMGEVKKSIKSNFFSRMGSIFLLGAFKGLKKKFDFNVYGGSPFLGCKKLIIKSHGSSKAKAIEASIDEIITISNKNLNEQIEKAVSKVNLEQLGIN